MSKRDRGFTETKYDKWVKEGRGQGTLQDYKPWLTIQDVPSNATCTRMLGIKTRRQHELLSGMEVDYLHILEYCDAVKDIREQYPLLPIEQTISIANELGIKHPADPKTSENIVMTTDFLVTVQIESKSILLARTIKSTEHINKERQIDKFEIERRYWKLKNIDWGIVTEKDINEVMAKNIRIVHPFYNIENMDLFFNNSPIDLSNICINLKNRVIGRNVVMRHIAEKFDEDMLFEPGTSIALLKHLIMTKQINIDMSVRLNLDTPQDIYGTQSVI
jgi:hypothetical protein